jgi:hypothetical protein
MIWEQNSREVKIPVIRISRKQVLKST